MKKTVGFDLTWVILLLVILKITGIIHLSWWWIVLPLGCMLSLAFIGIVMGFLGMVIALVALKTGKIKVTVKK